MSSLTRTVVALSAALVITVMNAPASTARAERFPLVGPEASVACSDLVPADSAADEAGPGFVVFNRTGSGKVTALVVLIEAAPNTRYPVRLLQDGTGDDCFDVDGMLTTNRHGNGTLRLVERDVGRRAQVIVDTSALTQTPTYRATHFFRTQ